MEKNIVKKILLLAMALLQGINNLFGPLLMTWTARATAFHFSGSSGTTCTRTSFNNSIADTPTRRCGESSTPRLTDTGSRFSFTNISTNSKPKSKQLES
jgi:hypothetical protein